MFKQMRIPVDTRKNREVEIAIHPELGDIEIGCLRRTMKGYDGMIPATESIWEPDAPEITKLLNGGNLRIVCAGHKLPVFWLSVTEPPPVFDDVNRERQLYIESLLAVIAVLRRIDPNSRLAQVALDQVAIAIRYYNGVFSS